jgi:hypothetical protein
MLFKHRTAVVPTCPTDHKGWWAYSHETEHLLLVQENVIRSWRFFLPSEVFFKVGQRSAVIRARIEQQRVALAEMQDEATRGARWS